MPRRDDHRFDVHARAQHRADDHATFGIDLDVSGILGAAPVGERRPFTARGGYFAMTTAKHLLGHANRRKVEPKP